MSHRIAQFEATLKKAISQVLQRDMADPRIDGMVSITRVKISSDLRDATIHVSILPEDKQSKNIHGLRHAAGHIRTLVFKLMATRTVPRLEFVLDDSLKKQAAVMEAIHRGLEKTPTQQDESPSSDDADTPDTTADKNAQLDIQTNNPPASED